ncbi:MAG: aminotransferase class I/II-fold pyridoxal phosphate-dependent enzyme [Phycisphaerae bacterium]|nr:aminotransferase class I/II-fold pyridoxal phosphate-dependent enzyme [Phycisphaerae bacterium]
MIDLRSDTITKPTAEMMHAMTTAPVGDDVLGDDPTVKALEERTAEVLGKEAALFMPSGTMSNQVALRCHTQPGDEIVIESEAHIYYYEAGAPAALAGVMCRLIPGQRGIFTGDALQAVLRPRDQHFPLTKLVCIENTTNRGGGSVWPIETLADVARVARQANLKMHLDGARLWNASVASGIAEQEYANYFDTISVCFSKGLGAPIGSALAGSAECIARARRFRKQYGGGMRQAGLIAAGALYGLEHHRKRLAEDHANAKNLAVGIAKLQGIDVDIDSVETNIVIGRVNAMPSEELAAKLYKEGVNLLATGPGMFRAVTNLTVRPEDITRTIEAFSKVQRMK